MAKIKDTSDIIRCNKMLKKLVRKRAEEFRVSLQKICKKQNVNWLKLKSWLQTFDPESPYNFLLSQGEIIKVAEQLGIEIRMDFILHNNLDLAEYKSKVMERAREKKETEFQKYKKDWELPDFSKEEIEEITINELSDNFEGI